MDMLDVTTESRAIMHVQNIFHTDCSIVLLHYGCVTFQEWKLYPWVDANEMDNPLWIIGQLYRITGIVQIILEVYSPFSSNGQLLQSKLPVSQVW